MFFSETFDPGSINQSRVGRSILQVIWETRLPPFIAQTMDEMVDKLQLDKRYPVFEVVKHTES